MLELRRDRLEPAQPINRSLRFVFYSLQQCLAGRNILDEADAQTRTPDPVVRIAVLVDDIPQ